MTDPEAPEPDAPEPEPAETAEHPHTYAFAQPAMATTEAPER